MISFLYLLIVGVEGVAPDHGDTHHARRDSSGRGIGPTQRPVPHNTQNRLLCLHLQGRYLMSVSVSSVVHFVIYRQRKCGPGSSVGIATDYGIESRWRRDFSSVQSGPGAHSAPCKMGTGSFPGVKCGRGVMLTTHPLLVPRSWKSRAIPLPTLWATPGL